MARRRVLSTSVYRPEAALIEELAAQRGVSVSEFMRAVMLEQVRRDLPSAEAWLEALRRRGVVPANTQA